MKVLNTKIYLELLPDDDQPKRTILKPDAEMMKHYRVLDVGHRVEIVKKDDIVTTYVNNVMMLDTSKGLCSERDIVFINHSPQPGKINITDQSKVPLTGFKSGRVLSSGVDDISKDDRVYYKPGQSHVLPDHTELISETNIYFKK